MPQEKKLSRFQGISKFPFNLPYISEPNAIPNEDYHNGEAFSAFVSSSGIKLYKTSPLWFQYAIENDAVTIGEEAKTMGNLYHDYLASIANCGDKSLFMEQYVLFDAPVNPTTGSPYGMNTKKYTEVRDEVLLKNPGRMLMTQAALDTIESMAKHLRFGSRENSKDIQVLLKWGSAERSYFCEYEGAYFKFRTDLSTGKKIVDWKTISSEDLHEETIRRQIFNYGYDISAAFYQFFNKIITGKWKEFYWVFQQKTPPYDFVIVDSQPFTFEFANELINGKREKIVTNTHVGARKMISLVEQHIHCVEEDYWPGAAVFIQEGVIGSVKGKRIMDCDIPVYLQKDLTFYNS